MKTSCRGLFKEMSDPEKRSLHFLALLLSALNGYQGALMAPTEVLAVQHYENISEMLENINPASSRTFDRSMTMSQKKKAYARIESGEAAIYNRNPRAYTGEGFIS